MVDMISRVTLEIRTRENIKRGYNYNNITFIQPGEAGVRVGGGGEASDGVDIG